MDMTSFFNKCGEIGIALRNGVRIFEFTCVICNEICTQWEEFAMHIDIQHSDDFLLKTELTTEHEFDVNSFCLNQEEGSSEDEASSESVLNNETVTADMTTDDGFVNMDYANDDGNINNDTNDNVSEGDVPHMTSTDEKVLTLAIILCYEKHRIIWDSAVARLNDTEKQEEAYEEITSSINRQLGLKLNTVDVKKRIKHLHLIFHSELQNEKLALEKGNKYSMPWFFDKLRFLDGSNSIEVKLEVGNSSSKRNIGLPLANLSDAEHLEFFKIYEGFPCLWDIYHIGFHTKKLRQEAMDEMQQAVNTKLVVGYSSTQLQRKLYDIRYTCTQEKQRKLKYERAEKPFKPKCKFYDKLAFLLPNIHPFKCPYCDKMFNSPQPYFVHKNVHDGEKPFKCTICGHAFMTAGNCTVHVRRHTLEYPYSCEVCEKKFPASSELTLHMRYHSGEKPYICEVCGQSFFRASTLEYHMRRHRNIRGFKCSVCSKAFFDNSQLKEHMHGHLNIRDKVCNVCGKAFAHAKHLRQHKQIHAEKKKYKCKICEKDFAQYAGLSGHMKLHGTTLKSLKSVVTSS